MNLRVNKILVGIILLIIGVGGLFQRYVNIDYGSAMLFFSGLGLLLLYRTKRKTWSLVLGCYITYIGGMNFLDSLGLSFLIPLSTVAMFFLIPGIIFLVQYYDRNKPGLLLPSMLFLWIGVYVFIAGSKIFSVIPMSGASLFFICVGLGFLCAYYIGKDFLSKAFFYLGLGIIAIGVISMREFFEEGIFGPLFFLSGMSWIPSCVIIVIAVVIILRQIKKK